MCTYHRKQTKVCAPCVRWLMMWLDCLWAVLKSTRHLEEVVPYVQKLVLAQVPVEIGVLHTDEHGLLMVLE